jgi:hypothetical protein
MFRLMMRPPPCFVHVWNRRPRGAYLRHDLDLDVMREFGVGHLVERRLPGAARIVHDNVDAAEALDRFLDEALHVAGFRRVRHHRQHFNAEFPALGGFLFHDLSAPRAYRHRRA